MKKYTLEKFLKKYEGQRHIYCGINYIDGEHDECKLFSDNILDKSERKGSCFHSF